MVSSLNPFALVSIGSTAKSLPWLLTQVFPEVYEPLAIALGFIALILGMCPPSLHEPQERHSSFENVGSLCNVHLLMVVNGYWV